MGCGSELPPERYDWRRMQLVRVITNFLRLPADRRSLIIEATASLALASAALALLPFRRAIRLGSVSLGKESAGNAERVVSAVETVSRRLPWRNVCIHKGIAAQRMLRRRGFDAVLHYGISNDREGGRLAAHVWVSLDGSPVIGGEEASAYTPVGAFP